jgi:hypothetical protein
VRSWCASQFALEGNQLLESVVLVQVLRVVRPLSGLAGALLKVCLIGYLCLPLFVFLTSRGLIISFGSLLAIEDFLSVLMASLSL